MQIHEVPNKSAHVQVYIGLGGKGSSILKKLNLIPIYIICFKFKLNFKIQMSVLANCFLN